MSERLFYQKLTEIIFQECLGGCQFEQEKSVTKKRLPETGSCVSGSGTRHGPAT
ncbi:MAG: hypothetical protein K0M50_12850 [Prolixibacteraceae bacterium]|nr:hypothetical protein [Prolixibacteraceae bacterium]